MKIYLNNEKIWAWLKEGDDKNNNIKESDEIKELTNVWEDVNQFNGVKRKSRITALEMEI